MARGQDTRNHPNRLPRLEAVIDSFTHNGTGESADIIAEAREDRANESIDYYGGGSPAQDIIQSALAQHRGHDITPSNANAYGKSHDFWTCNHPSCKAEAEKLDARMAGWSPSSPQGQWANGQYYNFG